MFKGVSRQMIRGGSQKGNQGRIRNWPWSLVREPLQAVHGSFRGRPKEKGIEQETSQKVARGATVIVTSDGLRAKPAGWPRGWVARES